MPHLTKKATQLRASVAHAHSAHVQTKTATPVTSEWGELVYTLLSTPGWDFPVPTIWNTAGDEGTSEHVNREDQANSPPSNFKADLLSEDDEEDISQKEMSY